ncbi:MAG: DNA polymerase III subunit delta [Bacilli bacterium]|nr:DNA polymerase III subunit delta [Bacilli bacterium]
MSEIYLFTGTESYLINNKIERIIKESKANEYNVSTYDEEEEDIFEAMRDVSTPPFLSEYKVITIKNPKFLTSEKSLSEKESEMFLNYLANPLSSSILIINANNLKLDERKEVVKKLKKAATVQDVKQLSEIELLGWIKRQCSLSNVNIRDDAVRSFKNLAGSSLLNAKNELNKLISYAGPNGTITTEMVQKVVVKEIQNDAFALTNAIIDQDKPKIISLYNELINLGNDVNYLFSLVTKSIRETLLVGTMLKAGYRQADVAYKMKVSNGRAYYLVKNARSMDLDKVKDYVIKLGDLDYKIKSGQIEMKNGFEFFLFGL